MSQELITQDYDVVFHIVDELNYDRVALTPYTIPIFLIPPEDFLNKDLEFVSASVDNKIDITQIFKADFSVLPTDTNGKFFLKLFNKPLKSDFLPIHPRIVDFSHELYTYLNRKAARSANPEEADIDAVLDFDLEKDTFTIDFSDANILQPTSFTTPATRTHIRPFSLLRLKITMIADTSVTIEIRHSDIARYLTRKQIHNTILTLPSFFFTPARLALDNYVSKLTNGQYKTLRGIRALKTTIEREEFELSVVTFRITETEKRISELRRQIRDTEREIRQIDRALQIEPSGIERRRLGARKGGLTLRLNRLNERLEDEEKTLAKHNKEKQSLETRISENKSTYQKVIRALRFIPVRAKAIFQRFKEAVARIRTKLKVKEGFYKSKIKIVVEYTGGITPFVGEEGQSKKHPNVFLFKKELPVFTDKNKIVLEAVFVANHIDNPLLQPHIDETKEEREKRERIDEETIDLALDILYKLTQLYVEDRESTAGLALLEGLFTHFNIWVGIVEAKFVTKLNENTVGRLVRMAAVGSEIVAYARIKWAAQRKIDGTRFLTYVVNQSDAREYSVLVEQLQKELGINI